MKYVVIIGDGMADYPLEELGGKTPLQVAQKPNMDEIARKGKCGLLTTVPSDMPAGSDVANLSIMGYDPRRYYTGRGPFEAASVGVDLAEDDVAFRCNFISVVDDKIADYSAGHISTEEAAELIPLMKENFSSYGEFHLGISYRHLFVTKGGADLECTPPHDVIGEAVEDHLIKPGDDPLAVKLNEMTIRSQEVLADHPLHEKRLGKNPANSIWLWGQGRRPKMETMEDKWKVKGAVISAVDLLKGIGKYAGMEIIDVPGATGYYDTDYEAKADYALKALLDVDYVYVHVEAPDEAGHAGDLDQKITCIEELDSRLISRIMDGAPQDCKIAVLPDHLTPIPVKTHVRDPVPFAIYSPGEEGDDVERFDEKAVKKGSYGLIESEDFMKTLLG